MKYLRKNKYFILASFLILVVILVLFNFNQAPDTSNVLRVKSAYASTELAVVGLGIKTGELQVSSAPELILSSNISITGPRDSRVDDDFELGLGQQASGEYALSLKPKASQFRPGRYTVSADIPTPQGVRHIEQDFLWGVLAVNPNKSIYKPGDTAKLALAVLDERGNMVCDAQLTLKIQSPRDNNQKITNTETLSTSDGSIVVNEECRQKRVTQRPDYEADYQVGEPGIYQMTLTAETANGSYTIEDYFEVRDSVLFDIERITATRIYPVHEYEVKIHVTSKEDFQGIVTEYVPESFDISKLSSVNEKTAIASGFSGMSNLMQNSGLSTDFKDSTADNSVKADLQAVEVGGIEPPDSWLTSRSPHQVTPTADLLYHKTISWPVDWKAGQSYELSYVYDAPDVSPDFKLLGPLRFYTTDMTYRSDMTYTTYSGGEESRTASPSPAHMSNKDNKSDRLVFREARQWQVAVDAEATIDATVRANQPNRHKNQPKIVFISDQVGYMFYSDDDNACDYAKTTNGGTSWAAGVTITDTTNCQQITIWYDQWTPGDTSGTFIHLAATDGPNNDIVYERLDTSDDSQLGDTIIINQTTGLTSPANISITKATDGEIYVGLVDDNAGFSKVRSCSSSCGTAGNWSDVGTTPLDDSFDYITLLPLASGNIMIIRDDLSTNDTESNIWNGSSWAGWVDIDINAVESANQDEQQTISATVDKSDNNIYLTYVADVGLSTADIRTAVYNGTSWSTKTDVATNQDTLTTVSIFIDQNNDDIYVAYLRGTVGSSMNAYYKKSTDGMTSWGTETQFNTTNSDLFYVGLNMMSDERIYGYYHQDSTNDGLFGNTLVDLTSNSAPTITTVTDTPDPTNPNRSVTFSVDWDDAGDSIKAKICKTDSLTSQNCDGGFWASSSAFTTQDPEKLVYDVVSGDHGQTRSYYAFVCDDSASCSASASGTFSVNAASTVPNVKFR